MRTRFPISEFKLIEKEMRRRGHARTISLTRSLPLAVVSVLVPMIALPGPALGQQRSSVISFSSPQFAWDVAPTDGANAAYDPQTGEPCGSAFQDRCDATLLHVNVGPSFWSSRPGGLVVRVIKKNPEELTNLDLYVYSSDAGGNRGSLVASSANFNEKGEVTRVPKASGYYLIQVVYAEAVTPSAYSGEATIVPSSASTPKHGAEVLGLTCGPQDVGPGQPTGDRVSKDGVPQTWCDGEIPSFDGLGLHTGVILPLPATKPLPTVLMLHAWGGGRGEWTFTDCKNGRTSDSNCSEVNNPGQHYWNNTWFAAKGYASVAYTARGFGQSCGMADQTPKGPDGEPAPCAWGWTHLAERDFETRDSQHVLGVMVDVGIIDPDRIAATGGSYGGGQTWLLATSLPWWTPSGSRTLQLAAAVPQFTWSDLLYNLVPNGRATDRMDQGASHERPHGIPKQSALDAVFVVGRVPPLPVLITPHGKGRFNDIDPSEQHSYFDGWLAFWQKGEPYDTPEGDALARVFRNKSAYHAASYFAAVRNGFYIDKAGRRVAVRAVPVFVIQGWTDAYVPGVEALQMYRKLKSAKSDYPIYVALGDFGHATAQNPVAAWDFINKDQVTPFLDAYMLAGGRGAPRAKVFSFATECPASADPTDLPELVAGASWDGLTTGAVGLRFQGSVTTVSGPPNAAEEGPTDPTVAGARCITQPPGTYPPLFDWTRAVPAGGFTLLGLPSLKVDYVLTGVDATIAAKLWDVAPDGTRTLVTRGAYRLSLAAGDRSAGTIVFQLFGNHWKFQDGHFIQLELSQTDAPFLRPDNLPSRITFSSPKLTLPSVEKQGS